MKIKPFPCIVCLINRCFPSQVLENNMQIRTPEGRPIRLFDETTGVSKSTFGGKVTMWRKFSNTVKIDGSGSAVNALRLGHLGVA